MSCLIYLTEPDGPFGDALAGYHTNFSDYQLAVVRRYSTLADGTVVPGEHSNRAQILICGLRMDVCLGERWDGSTRVFL